MPTDPTSYFENDPRWGSVVREARTEPFSEVLRTFVRAIDGREPSDSILESIYGDELNRRWALISKEQKHE